MAHAPEIESHVLAANAAFYRAFNSGDGRGMVALWSEEHPVACFHPGSPVLLGRLAVSESFRAMLLQPPAFKLRCDRPVVNLLGNVAVVTCYEGTNEQPAHLAATNVFVLENGSWRMIHHHAGPLATPLPKSSADLNVN